MPSLKNHLKNIVRPFRKTEPTPMEKYKRYLDIDPSTFFTQGLRLNFYNTPEDRVYLKAGSKCLLNAAFTFESCNGKIVIGNNVQMNGVSVVSHNYVEVGNDVLMAWDILLYDHDSHNLDWEVRKMDHLQCYSDYINEKKFIKNKNWSIVNSAPIIIGDKAWIGFGVSVLKGVTIGEGAVIGAKSVVTKSIPSWTLAAGNPAIVIRELPKR